MSIHPCPKPEPRARIEGRLQRFATRLVANVRAQCVERDGYCRIGKAGALARLLFGECAGPSQWAHVGEWRRWNTMGQQLADRHSTRTTVMLCQRHHDGYDGRPTGAWIDLGYGPDGADGPLRARLTRLREARRINNGDACSGGGRWTTCI